MSDNYDLLLLEFVRRLGAKVDALAGQLRDLRQRVTRAEQQRAASAAAEAVHRAVTMVQLERLKARLERIERDRADPA